VQPRYTVIPESHPADIPALAGSERRDLSSDGCSGWAKHALLTTEMRSLQTVNVTSEDSRLPPPVKRLSGFASWHPDCYQRAMAYVTDPRGRLLVFDHVGVDAGTQVPAGGIHDGESPDEAVRRELLEEAGLDDATVVRKLGEAWNRSEPGLVPPGLEEQVLHAFHLRLTRPSPQQAWIWEERSGGEAVEHRFALHWVSLQQAAELLWPAQAMWIPALRTSLRHL
jgi:8-oxo-dGTP pyrophosphatase MutT (NUDIX family)